MKNSNKEIQLKEEIVRALKEIHDPEIPVDIYELGLIYDIKIMPSNNVYILITLTSPACPAAEEIPNNIKNRVEMIEEINNVEVEITFDPPYSSDLMSEEAKLELGFM
tara:strand:- start:210 stop:533 length:324 start_codon:yes stop_codon:yes gene_type:complete